LLFKAYYRSVNSHARAERIRVRDLMSHDHDLILRDNKLTQRLCLDAGFYTGILRGLLLFPAKIRDAVAVLDNRLVPSSGKRKIDRHAGILVAQGIRRGIQTEPDAQCS